jgi:hypothetical protein
MQETSLPANLPKWLQKDIVSTQHEVPVAGGRSHTVCENYYTPQVFRWAIQEWLETVPQDGDLAAFRRALPLALTDTSTFHAYLRVPEAFEELYRNELSKLNEHRGELRRVQRALKQRPSFRRRWSRGQLYAGLIFAYLLAVLAR